MFWSNISNICFHFLPGFWSPKQATFWVVSSRSVHSDLDRHDSILVHICMHFPRANAVLICNRWQTKHQSMGSSTWKQRPCGKFTYEFGIVWPWQNIVLLCSSSLVVVLVMSCSCHVLSCHVHCFNASGAPDTEHGASLVHWRSPAGEQQTKWKHPKIIQHRCNI